MDSHGAIRTQYKDDRNLNARIAIHARFSTNAYGWSRWVFDRLSFSAKAQILELGCGPGGLWSANRHRVASGWRVTLTDFSAGMVKSAHANLAEDTGPFGFAIVDAQSIPYADASLDGVLANHMLYHVPDRRRALKEASRILRRDGCFYATTVGESHMREMWDLLVPFIPDVHSRVNAISRGFTLENGSAQLAECFDHIEVDEYPDDLEITEVEPLIAYLKSSPTSVVEDLTPQQLDQISQRIGERINTQGSFHIHKSSGIFVAGKR